MIFLDFLSVRDPSAEIFFGITFFGSLVTASVMMQYRKPVQQEIDCGRTL